MDFIANLIKRPISLVLNETSNTMDKCQPISTSLPNTPSKLETISNAIKPTAIGEESPMNANHNYNNNKRSLSMSFSYNDDNMTDFIGVPENFLDEFQDILPPPPLISQNTDSLNESIFHVDSIRSLSNSPLPPPLSFSPSQSDQTLTPSMKVSQTIDELLLQINDNLQQAGLNDEVLSIASPPNHSKLSPLSNKTALNNLKLTNSSSTSSASNHQISTIKTSTTAAGPADTKVFENNIHTDLEMAAGIFVEHNGQDQLDQLNISGVNKLSNKFVGLTEFDEAKIPELPGDLNPNIEEQYKVTFEEFLIPTLNAQQKKVTDEFIPDNTHLLPSESDAISSENETFADCNDDRDPLASTYVETNSLNATTDLESYQSAVNHSIHINNNDTMENIADLTIDAKEQPLWHNLNQIQVQDEPMDIDMNATIESVRNTSSNIQNIENLLQEAENILQHTDVEIPLQEKDTEFVLGSLERQSEITASTIEEEYKENKDHHIEIEQSKHELSLNKNIELLVSSEYVDKDEIKKTESSNDCMNSSIVSNYSAKSLATANKTETTLTEITLQKSSAPASPSFPIKSAQNDGFPRSPKSVFEKSKQSFFLEKSDYSVNDPNQVETLVEKTAISVPNNINGTFVEHLLSENGNKVEKNENVAEPKNKRQTFSVDDSSDKQKRQTFNKQSNETLSPTLNQFPSMDKPEHTRRTFSVNDTANMPEESVPVSVKNNLNTRHTFDAEEPSEQTTMNNSFEPMDVDDTISQNKTLPMPTDVEPGSQTSPLPENQTKSKSPPLPVMQHITQSPLTSMEKTSPSTIQQMLQNSFETLQQSPESPSLPTMQYNKSHSPTVPSSVQQIVNIKKEKISPPTIEPATSTVLASQSLSALIQKRPPIRDARARATEILSAKEQSNIRIKDEKDVNAVKFTPSPIEDTYTADSTTLTNSPEIDPISSYSTSIFNNGESESRSEQQEIDDEFKGNNNLILNPSDFDYLLTKGNNNTPVDRSSLLLKFDPLLGVPVPLNQGYQQQLQQLQIPTNIINPSLSPTLEEDEHNDSNHSFVIDTKATSGISETSAGGATVGLTEASAKLLKERSQAVKQQLQLEQQVQQNKLHSAQEINKKNATMSVDVIKDMSLNNDCNKAFENSNSTQSDDKQINYKMDELEKKIKNEVLKTEDIEKKLKDAELREEALIKRITEKDKTIAKMNGVIEAYEKAIAELIADKEQLTQHYEKQLAEVKADRDSNYHHLTSLETTFSDLHVKYEKSKEMTCQLKESEEALQAEKRKALDNLHLQEQRYDKMKNHAMQQLEIANKKLESLTRDHSIETTKLKALLKKEEIARSSINEQLAQKTKENVELVKICDELISGQGS